MEVFVEFSLIFLIIFGVSVFMRMLKLPLIIGYIITGIIAGPYMLDLISHSPIIPFFSQIGVILLLFVVGLHISSEVVKDVGKVSLVTGLGQILFTSSLGFLIFLAFGFDLIPAIFMAISLTFSSTIIIMKLLSDKGEGDQLYGRITLGFLIIQDIVAIVILMVISSFENSSLPTGLFFAFANGFIALISLYTIAHYIIPRMDKDFTESHEFLFVFSITWGFGLAILFSKIGFSVEVGALIAGILMSFTKHDEEIIQKLTPLRDFFLISFFLILGSSLVFVDMSRFVIPIIVISLFVLIGNPLIVMTLIGFFGYSKKTRFKSGLAVAQISVFSLMIVSYGVDKGYLAPDMLSVVTFIAIFTIGISTYMIMHSDAIFEKLSPYLDFLLVRKK